VRELIARLQAKDPDFLVVVDAASQSLMVVNPRPGFSAAAESQASCDLSKDDQQFLRDLHIKD
jgi:hypothetical protein